MRIVRLIAWLLLLTALATGIADIVAFLTHGGTWFRSASDWWASASPGTLLAYRDAIHQISGDGPLEMTVAFFLAWPACFLFLLKSAVLFFIARLTLGR